MSEIPDFGLIVLVVSAGVSLALFGRAITERLAIPSAALFLVAAAVVSDLVPRIHDEISFVTVERIGVVALIVILFEGGLDIGWRRFRAAAVPILSLGILGTFASAALIAVAAHVLFDLSWITSGMLGAALAPTDPAVTFSVLGGREIHGRTGTILKGESGANDPVGIALMIGMIELATADHGSFWTVVEEFVDRDGRRRRGRRGRRGAPPAADAARHPAVARSLPAAGRGRRRCDLRSHHAHPRLRLPRGIRGGDPDRRPGRAAPAGDRRVPRLARRSGGDRDVRRARPHDRPDGAVRLQRLVRGARPGGAAGVRDPAARRRDVCCSRSSSTGASGCS